MDTSKAKGPEEEDKHLIDALIELHNEGKFKAEGNFKPGHLKELENKLRDRMPRCDLQAKPHIESRMKTLKTHFQVVHEMLTGPYCSGFGWDSERKVITAEKPVWDAYLESHKEATPYKTKAFPFYDDLCMVFGKDRATGRNAETPADVVDKLDNHEEVDLDEDDFNSTNNMMGNEEVQSMSCSEAPKVAQSQSDGSSKKKRKNANNGDAYEALKESSYVIARVIEKASIRLSKAIGEDMNEKHMQLGDELKRTTTLTTMERHKVARMIMQDNAMVSYFFSVPDNSRDEWVRALLDGTI
ncbi:Myb/SANT-like domain containing protein [Trema orientale]|uniref:Myb/SANT-like domain containing protein n=1 Tax=Trema orientale TaxID=63057 RepID=A0A2P5EPY5_TREOI|nr:Myb/SANT-like domain containing protein [Trema orientale]